MSFGGILERLMPKAVAIDAVGNDTTATAMRRTNEFNLYHPKDVATTLGGNDRNTGVAVATCLANLKAIDAGITNATGTKYFSMPTAWVGADITPIAFSVRTNFPTRFIDLFTPTTAQYNDAHLAQNMSFDGTHPNDLGHDAAARAIYSKINQP